MKKTLLAIAASTIAISGFAFGLDEIEKSVPLKDGSTVHIFDDGKMGMENVNGHAFLMSPGTTMETKNGQKITMVGNEVARLERVLFQDNRN